MTTPVVRYAPSPTGKLHLGNARPMLINWLFATARSGDYILRLDDTDTARSTEESARGIEEDLAWLGITPAAKVRQSDRTALYDAARDRLIAAGRLYPAYETEDELDRKRARARALGKPPIYDRSALSLTDAQKAAFEAEGRKPHWRFKLDGRPVHFDDMIKGPQTVNTASMSDPVLVRADGTYLYTLPSVVDDIDLDWSHGTWSDGPAHGHKGEEREDERMQQKRWQHRPGEASPRGEALEERVGREVGTENRRARHRYPIAPNWRGTWPQGSPTSVPSRVRA